MTILTDYVSRIIELNTLSTMNKLSNWSAVLRMLIGHPIYLIFAKKL